MINSLWLRARNARKSKGLTQEFVARELGISRPSYIKFEDGERELSLSQADSLSKLLGITLLESPEKTQTSISKLRSMMLAFIKLAGAEGDGRITKTKLAKLLYFADAQMYLNRDGHTISGMTYRVLPQGPVAYEYLQLLDDMVDEHIIDIKFSGLAQMIGTVEPVDLNDLDLEGDELEMIRLVAAKWKDKRTDALVNYTHEQPIWRQDNMYAPIDMSLLRNWDKPVY